MKRFFAMSAFVAAAAVASPVRFECSAYRHVTQGDYLVSGKVVGSVNANAEGYVLTPYHVSFKVETKDTQKGKTVISDWGKASWNGKDHEGERMLIGNDKNYKPRKYKDHLKFELSKGFDNAWVDLILPKFTDTEGDIFEGYLIITAFQDHFGGTMRMDCELK